MNLRICLLVPFAMACGEPSSPSTDAAPPGDVAASDAMIDAALVDAAPAVPITLAMNEPRPTAIATFGGTVYWATDPATNQGQIRKVAPGGVAEPLLTTLQDRPSTIAAGDGFIEPNVFWGTATLLGQVKQIAATGAPPTTIYNVNDVVYTLVLDGDAIFYGSRSALYRKGLASSVTPTMLVGGYANGVVAIDADAAGVVFAARKLDGSWIIASIARTGGEPVTLATTSMQVGGIAIADGNVFWLEQRAIKRVPRAGGAPTTHAMFGNLESPAEIVADQGQLFVATNQGVINPSGATGRILRIDAVSGTIDELATSQPEPTGIAIDATNVYWANRGLAANQGQIVKLAR